MLASSRPVNRSVNDTLVTQSLSALRRIPLTLGLTTAALAIAAIPDADALLQYDRTAMRVGELWRLATGHLAHWNFDHWLWDTVAFLILGAYCEFRERRMYARCLAVGTAAVSTGLILLRPDVQLYRGLSGLDSALFVLAAWCYGSNALRADDRTGFYAALGAAAAFLGKVAYESLSGRTLFVDSAAGCFEPLPLSHLLGAAAAVVVAAMPDLWKRARRYFTFASQRSS
ncbi:MAG: rhombosortase [Pirellula sp.]|nr:rhombosortase [Pirellula sp.]